MKDDNPKVYSVAGNMFIRIGSFLIGAVIIVGLALYGFKAGFYQKEQSSVPITASSSRALKLEIPKTATRAPEFELSDSAGKRQALKELAGKVVFLNFWATWCPPCIEEMPAMEKLHRELGDEGLVVLAVNFQESPERVKQFLSEHNLTFTALLDRDGKVAEQFQAWALPVSVIVNKRGEIAAKAVGIKDWYSEEARQLFQKLLSDERDSG
jgi:peroxiredoxin